MFNLTSDKLKVKGESRDLQWYFGRYNGENEHMKNDYVLPAEDSSFAERHFLIQYIPKHFFISNLTRGKGTFVKILQELVTFISFFHDSAA